MYNSAYQECEVLDARIRFDSHLGEPNPEDILARLEIWRADVEYAI